MKPISYGYIKGFEECLDSFTKLIDKIKDKPDMLNQLIFFTHTKRIEVMDMKDCMDEAMEKTLDPFKNLDDFIKSILKEDK